MQKRQAHNKSRRGCWQCKKGHIKCDESRPQCARCLRRGDECDYSPLRHLRQNVLQSPTSVKALTEKTRPLILPVLHQGRNLSGDAGLYQAHEAHAIHPRGSNSSPEKHLLELRLIHIFISGAECMQKSYRDGHHVQLSIDNIFQIAAQPKHRYVMDIIMGVAAMSLRTTKVEDHVLVEASHVYALRAIRECSKQISSGVSEANAEGLFIASLMIAMYAFTSQQFDGIMFGGGSSTGQIPLLSWLRQFQGVKAIRNQGWAWIQSSETIRPMLSALPAQTSTRNFDSPGFFNYLLEDLNHNGTTPGTLSAYTEPVAYMSNVMAEPEHHGLLGFPMSVSEKFLELLEIRDPRSMTIIGTYLAMITLSRRSRHMIGAAKRDFQFIMAQLPEEWLLRMEWAQNIFALDEAEPKSGDSTSSHPGIGYLSSSI